jgi:prepilin-type processing-associated H-X9-DG protein
MESAPEQAGVLYIDGHVRVYNGQQTQLPRHHVARQKLCLRATTDYWVNALDGQPFMVVNKAVDPGLSMANRIEPFLAINFEPLFQRKITCSVLISVDSFPLGCRNTATLNIF